MIDEIRDRRDAEEPRQPQRRRPRVIVNCSSIFGLNGYADWSLYVASKHALTGMTNAAALDYATRGIRINAVGPGPIETPLLAKTSAGNPHVYASVVPWAASAAPKRSPAPSSGYSQTPRASLPDTHCRWMAGIARSDGGCDLGRTF